MEQKLCRICGKFKDIDNFAKNEKMVDGHRNECRECKNKLYNDKEKAKKRSLDREIKNEGKKVCRFCKIEKDINDFSIARAQSDGRCKICKICAAKAQEKYREVPGFKEKQKEYDKKRYDEKREEILEKKKEYHVGNRYDILKKKKEYRKDPEVKEREKEWRQNNKERFNILMKKYKKKNPHSVAWRSILHSALKRLGSFKQDHTINMLGYSAKDLKYHIESLFTEGMSWDNYGEWQIDHIIPVVTFTQDDDVKVVCALENLRPLWKTTITINGVVYEGNLNRSKF